MASGIVLRVLCELTHLILTLYEIGTLVTLWDRCFSTVLWIRKLWPRSLKLTCPGLYSYSISLGSWGHDTILKKYQNCSELNRIKFYRVYFLLMIQSHIIQEALLKVVAQVSGCLHIAAIILQPQHQENLALEVTMEGLGRVRNCSGGLWSALEMADIPSPHNHWPH